MGFHHVQNHCSHRDIIEIYQLNRGFTNKKTNKYRQLQQHAHYTRNKDFKSASWRIKSSDSSSRYWVSHQRGHLNDIKDEVSIFFSKRHPKDRSPEYFMTTDLSLSPPDGLIRLRRSWAMEVGHLYLKVRLGLGDFRLRYYEGITRYFDLVGLTLAYLHWRRVEESNSNLKTLSDVIALHRQDQQSTFLRYFGEQTLKLGSVDLAIANLLTKATWASMPSSKTDSGGDG